MGEVPASGFPNLDVITLLDFDVSGESKFPDSPSRLLYCDMIPTTCDDDPLADLLEDLPRSVFSSFQQDLHDAHETQLFAPPVSPKRALYCLAYVDSEGIPIREATAKEVEELSSLLGSSEPRSDYSGQSTLRVMELKDMATTQLRDSSFMSAPSDSDHEDKWQCDSPQEESLQQGVLEHRESWNKSKIPMHKACGPCDHCAVKDSPQWRRGPADKPTLCNACGIRFRRTNHLGFGPESAGTAVANSVPESAVPKKSSAKKRTASPFSSSKNRVTKQARQGSMDMPALSSMYRG